jgi:hypothetical protein
MNLLLIFVAVLLVGIGVDILRFPKQPDPTQREDNDFIFGKGAKVTDFMRREVYWARAPRSGTMFALAIFLIAVGIAFLTKALGIF